MGDLDGALRQFEATEANLKKLMELWGKIRGAVPEGVCFGANPEFEELRWAYGRVLKGLPSIDGWRPSAEPISLDEIAQNRFDAMEIDEIECKMATERSIDEPGEQIREYRFRLQAKRRQLVRGAVKDLRDEVDGILAELDEEFRGAENTSSKMAGHPLWEPLENRVKQIDVLLGDSVQRPPRWGQLFRHLGWAQVGDLQDIISVDWPDAREHLILSLYDGSDPLPVEAADLGDLVGSAPRGPIATRLRWDRLSPEEFERLVFALVAEAPGYANPKWLVHTHAPDRGRDLSAERVIEDSLGDTVTQRVIFQCKHWQGKSISTSDVSTLKDQMRL
ncbi:MAG: restriction endonuclease, partial [Cyanobacteria bacterium REEB65]|nr:restriction endonuclease [Cyanobacteria bacterium REEB65]